jgi:hypothetical protein
METLALLRRAWLGTMFGSLGIATVGIALRCFGLGRIVSCGADRRVTEGRCVLCRRLLGPITLWNGTFPGSLRPVSCPHRSNSIPFTFCLFFSHLFLLLIPFQQVPVVAMGTFSVLLLVLTSILLALAVTLRRSSLTLSA